MSTLPILRRGGHDVVTGQQPGWSSPQEWPARRWGWGSNSSEEGRVAAGLTLLVAQRDQRVHRHRATGGHIAGDDRDDGQEARDAGQADGVGRRDVVENGLQVTRYAECADQAENDPDPGQADTLAEHQPE